MAHWVGSVMEIGSRVTRFLSAALLLSLALAGRAPAGPERPNPAASAPPRLPRPLPELSLFNLDAEPVPLVDFRGNVVLLEFWATGCKPCLKRMSELEKLQKTRRDAGLVVLGVSIDRNAAPVQKFLDQRPLTYPVLLDLGREPAWEALDVHAVPATFLVNRAGMIVRRWSGKIEPKKVTAAVDSLLLAEPSAAR